MRAQPGGGAPAFAVYGVDFTSAPSKTKPLTAAVCSLIGDELRLKEFKAFSAPTVQEAFDSFLAFMRAEKPHIVGFDFPFSQSHKMQTGNSPLFDDLTWPVSWPVFASRISNLSRFEFVSLFERYKENRKPGDKQHKRIADELTNAQSPQTLYYTPVGRMYYEGVKLFLSGLFSVVPVQMNDSGVLAVEAYPGLFVREMTNAGGYKCESKDRKKMKDDLVQSRLENRRTILACLSSAETQRKYGLRVRLDDEMRELTLRDDAGDLLDSLICAVQAAWAWNRRNDNFELPGPDLIDPDILAFEGWIMDPHCRA